MEKYLHEIIIEACFQYNLDLSQEDSSATCVRLFVSSYSFECMLRLVFLTVASSK